jgi:tRNA A-37 threonylcarbamoyl transferase component Bud32
MAVAEQEPESTPAEICGYPIDRSLHAADGVPAFLAVGPGGRGIVLKGLDPDCLVPNRGLHPSIKERLARVRELALAGVANLHGVERDADHPINGHEAWLVWEHVDGQTFDEFADAPGRTPRELAVVCRELILTVDSLHLQGLVHGSIKGGNIIVARDRSVRMTHVSPLLYTDPSEDASDVVEMFNEAIKRRGEEETPLGRVISEAMAADWTDARTVLRKLGTRLATLVETRELPPPTVDPDEDDPAPRRRSMAGAILVLLLGLAVGYVVWAAVGHPPVPLPAAVQQKIDAATAGLRGNS